MKTEELCVHPAEMKVLAFWVCSLLTAGRNPFENLHSSLSGCKLSFFLNLHAWVSDVSRPTSQQTIRKRMPHKGHRQVISRPTVGALWSQSSAAVKGTGCEPTADMCGFESLVSKTCQKQLLCICCSTSPHPRFRQSCPAGAHDLLTETALVPVSDRLCITRFGGPLSVYLSLHQPGAFRPVDLPFPSPPSSHPPSQILCLNRSIDFPASRPLVSPSLGVSPYHLPGHISPQLLAFNSIYFPVILKLRLRAAGSSV